MMVWRPLNTAERWRVGDQLAKEGKCFHVVEFKWAIDILDCEVVPGVRVWI